MKRKLIFGIAGILMLSGFVVVPRVMSYLERERIDAANEATLRAVKQQDAVINPTVDSTVSVPSRAFLDIPWFCQAPHENPESWKIHKESCEEAALLMVLYHLTDRQKTDKDKIHAQLVDMIDWQMEKWGIHKDLHADSVKLLATGYFGFADDEVVIIRKADEDTIKSLLSRGFPVIVPTAGRMLGNPYFTPPGPLYHMVVVTGYTPDRVITNDIGTKRGRHFSYSWDVFMKSMQHEGGDAIILRVQSPRFPDKSMYKE